MWLFDKMMKRVVRKGELEIIDADGAHRLYGTPVEGRERIVARFTDKGAPAYIARHPRIGAGEAFMDGRLVIEQGDIRALIDLMRWNASWEAKRSFKNKGPIRQAIDNALGVAGRWNDERRSRQNVAHHYDLSADFYRLFLDSEMQYSCAYFRDPSDDLETAQLAKRIHIASKLALRPGLRVLDIGCGWGGMALWLHETFDVDVLGITLSTEQLAVAQARAAEMGVSDRVKFELLDYRKLEGRFDRIVSVGMFEHVGRSQFRPFFAKCRELLADDGVMLLHTIGLMGKPKPTDAFTAKYIFPGGYIPALSEIVAASQSVRLINSDAETLRRHYGYTLDHWYDRVVAAKDEIVAMYDERFYRMWTFYLAGARAAFVHGGMCNYQIQYVRNRNALPLTRDYMLETEARLASRPPGRKKAA